MRHLVLVAVAAIALVACASDDPSAENAPVAPATASTTTTTFPARTTANVSGVGPEDWILRDDDLCNTRAVPEWTDLEFPAPQREPQEPTAVPGATHQLPRGVPASEAMGSPIVALESGWSTATAGVPDLLRAAVSTAPGAETLHVWENCPADFAQTGLRVPRVHRGRLLTQSFNPSGLLVFDLADGELVGAVQAEVTVVGGVDDEDDVLVFVRHGFETEQATTLHRLDLATLELGPVLHTSFDVCCITPWALPVDFSVMVQQEADVKIIDVGDGSVRAAATVPPGRLGRVPPLQAGATALWATATDVVQAYDRKTLELIVSVPVDHLAQLTTFGDDIWITASDPVSLRGSIEMIDATTLERTEIASFDLYLVTDRGGQESAWTPRLRAVVGGVVFGDDRTRTDWFLAAPDN